MNTLLVAGICLLFIALLWLINKYVSLRQQRDNIRDFGQSYGKDVNWGREFSAYSHAVTLDKTKKTMTVTPKNGEWLLVSVQWFGNNGWDLISSSIHWVSKEETIPLACADKAGFRAHVSIRLRQNSKAEVGSFSVRVED
jgi:hypothetical protein